MEKHRILEYLRNVLKNMPTDWLRLTTHRLDIYEEKRAKTQFLENFEKLYLSRNFESSALAALPTAYDYIRLGHPLSCILEWAVAKMNQLEAENVISFSSNTIPLLAVLRKNALDRKSTRILYKGALPPYFEPEIVRSIYNYQFDLVQINKEEELGSFHEQGISTIYLSTNEHFFEILPYDNIDFYLNMYPDLGSILVVKGEANGDYISEIQHVRRRETVAMTPSDCFAALNVLIDGQKIDIKDRPSKNNKKIVQEVIKEITGSPTDPLVASSGLSIQYAIMMGLVHEAHDQHKGKEIKFVVPPNCYGGTNDQARRVAACLPQVQIVDLPVDGENDMVVSIDRVLDEIARLDAVPYIIAEIPTNPRVEVPDLEKLKSVLSKDRKTPDGRASVDPVFILDQTFCPNVHFLGEGEILSTVRTISYSSGSKFASGGLCNAGYCVGNKMTKNLMDKIEFHLQLCDNEATDFQLEIMAKQLPSMKERIYAAYKNTREFVDFIKVNLPDAKINFVSEELAKQGFTPSVFSLDLPTKGDSESERESYKRALNHRLIKLMITEIPDESKHCVSYGQLSGCYWTIPATSTQGTTKEGDKDYIARVALSPNMDLERHKKVFLDFVDSL